MGYNRSPEGLNDILTRPDKDLCFSLRVAWLFSPLSLPLRWLVDT